MKPSSRKRHSHSPVGILCPASLIALLLAAVSCGQTGPLTLPGPAAPASPTAEPDADAEEDQTEQNER
jgi:predicted small lipoprotein YifL